MTTIVSRRPKRAARAKRGVLWWVSRWAIPLYHAHLMWLLRRRFLILSHVGRVSGRVHRTCLMVLHEDRDRGEIVVAAGSRTADWYRNILAAPPLEVAIGRDRMGATVRVLDSHELRVLLGESRRQHRWTTRVQAAFFHWPWPASTAELEDLAGCLGGVALICLRPAPSVR